MCLTSRDVRKYPSRNVRKMAITHFLMTLTFCLITAAVIAFTSFFLFSSQKKSADAIQSITVVHYEFSPLINSTNKEKKKNMDAKHPAYVKLPKTSKTWECGQPKVKPAFTQGVPIENAVPHSWPWAVSIQARRRPHRPLEHICPGSIVAPRWVLSQDIIGFPNSTIIRVGVSNLSDPREAGTRDYRPHSAYNCPLCAGGAFCPTLVKLTENIEFNENVSAVCLAANDDDFVGQSSAILHSWSVLWTNDDPNIKSLLNRSRFENILNSEVGEWLSEPDVMKQRNMTISELDGYVFTAVQNALQYTDTGSAGVVKWRRDRWFLHALLLDSSYIMDFLQVSQCCEWFANVTDGEVKCQN